ncbi:MAG: DUF4350 domain-containing protein [Terriglobales bacterium]
MPVSLARGDRRLLYIALAIVAVMLVTLAFLTPREPDTEGSPSSYSTKRRGAKAAYLLLAQSGYKIERWEKGPADLPVNPQNELLIVAGPTQYPDRDETNALRKFVAAGGTLLVAGVWSDGFAPDSHVTFGKYRIGWAECKPALPTKISRGGPISMDRSMVWDKLKSLETLVHYSYEDEPVVVSYMVGRGEVIWWASDLPLTNAGIRDKNNLNLLINSIGEGKHILWDEYFQTAAAHEVVAFPPLVKWALLGQCVLFGMMLLFTYSRRSGPVIPLIPESRLSPLEFVDTLGNLYARTGAAQVPVEIAFQRFLQLAARRLGLYGTVSAQQLAQAMLVRRLVAGPEFSARLQRCEEAISDPSLTEKEALVLVRFLNHAAETLELTSAVPQEKQHAGDSSSAVPLPQRAAKSYRGAAGVH